MLKLFSRRRRATPSLVSTHYVGKHRPGTVEEMDEDGEVTLRRATPDEMEHAARVIAHIQGDLSGPRPRRPWTDARPRRPWTDAEPLPTGWTDSCGIESGYAPPLVLAPPPFDMPPQGICCAGCPGFDDKRCCARGS
ncbi:MAG: hypothetical protein M3P18_24855 [Actinomycetota bacterium]|nr:hypothetical protein [Actinomycetota bacterium]